MFDPNEFLNQPLGELSTERPLVPIGTYLTIIESIEMVPWQGKNDPTKSGYKLNVVYNFDDPKLLALFDRKEVKLTRGLMLDMKGNEIDTGKGKNVQLGRLRSAAKVADKPLNSLPGRPVKVHVTHDSYQGRPVEEINAWAEA
jgi:hypothetical protein